MNQSIEKGIENTQRVDSWNKASNLCTNLLDTTYLNPMIDHARLHNQS